jgi:hypothetical protein
MSSEEATVGPGGCDQEMASSTHQFPERTSRLAILGLGLSCFAVGLWVFTKTPAPLASAIAIAFAMAGRRKIRLSQGVLQGRGIATSGLWISILHLVLILPYMALGNIGFA